MQTKTDIIGFLEDLLPNASCELFYRNLYELLIAVVLSAQTTDKSVNKVTGKLFEKYPDFRKLSLASITDVEVIIRPIGLSKRKSERIIYIAQELINRFQGNIPGDINELIKIKGIGRKTASVVLIEGFKLPAFPVDTHVERVAKRLKIALETDNINKVEEKLKNYFEENKWIRMHHLLIHFGRYFCMAKKPRCLECQLRENCVESEKNYAS